MKKIIFNFQNKVFSSYQINSWAKHHSSLVLWYPHEDEEEWDGGCEDDEGVGEDVERQGGNPS